jgi:hypothetical protein
MCCGLCAVRGCLFFQLDHIATSRVDTHLHKISEQRGSEILLSFVNQVCVDNRQREAVVRCSVLREECSDRGFDLHT